MPVWEALGRGEVSVASRSAALDVLVVLLKIITQLLQPFK